MPGFPIDRRQGMGPTRGALVGLSREACNRAPLWWAPRGAMARARMAQACTGGTGQCGKPERFRCAVAPYHVEDGGVGQWGSEEGAEVIDSEIGSGIDGVTAVGWWRRSRPMSGSRAVRPKVRRKVARPASLQPNERSFSGERSESAATTG